MKMTIHAADLPRGGDAPKASGKSTNKRAQTEALFTEETEAEAKNKRIKFNEDGEEIDEGYKKNVWRGKLDDNVAKQGVMALACVKELADGMNAKASCSDVLGDLDDEAEAEDVLQVGQMVGVKITGAMDEKDHTLPVTLSPSSINNQLTLASIRNGTIIMCRVTSAEDKGFTLDMGIAGIRAFAAKDKMTKENVNSIRVDELRLMRVLSVVMSSRFVQMTTTLTMNNGQHQRIARADIQPGQLFAATVVEVKDTGVFVALDNSTRAYIRRSLLPEMYRNNLDALRSRATALPVVCIYCSAGGDMQAWSASAIHVNLDHIAARSCDDNQSNLLLAGDRCEGVVVHLSKGNAVHMRVKTSSAPIAKTKAKRGKEEKMATSLRQAVVEDEHFARVVIPRAHLNVKADAATDVIKTKYALNSKHECRVTSRRMFDRTFVASFKPTILKAAFVTVDAALPSTRCTAVVEHVIAKIGVVCRVNELVHAFIPLTHTHDNRVIRESDERVMKAFRKGTHHQCRVLQQEPSRGRVQLTARQTVVESKYEPIVEQGAEENLERSSFGTVILLNKGGALISFYSDVKAWMYKTEVDAAKNPMRLGDVILVRIVKTDAKSGNMHCVLADDKDKSVTAVQHAVKVLDNDTPITIEEKFKVERIAKSTSSAEFAVVGSCKTYGRASLLSCHFDDLLDDYPLALAEATKIIRSPLVLLAHRSLAPSSVDIGRPSMPSLCLSPVMHQLINQSNQTQLRHPLSFAELEAGQLVVCVCVRHHEQLGYFVQLPTKIGEQAMAGLVGHCSVDDNHGPTVGQTMVAKVTKVNLGKKRFNCTLKWRYCLSPSLNLRQMSSLLLSQAMRRVAEIATLVKSPSIGAHVRVIVTELTDVDGATVKLLDAPYKLCNAVILPRNLPPYTAGKSTEGEDEEDMKVVGVTLTAVVVAIDADGRIEMCTLRRAKEAHNQGVDEVKMEVDSDMEVKHAVVVAVRRDYITVMAPSMGHLLAVIPSRLHINHTAGAEGIRSKLSGKFKIVGRFVLGSELSIVLDEMRTVEGCPQQIWTAFASVDVDLFEASSADAPQSAALPVRPRSMRRLSSSSEAAVDLHTITGSVKKYKLGDLLTAKVTGNYRAEGISSCVVLKMDNGFILHLHASELPASYLDGSHICPLIDYTLDMRDKYVTAVVCHTKRVNRSSQHREYDVSLNGEKLSEAHGTTKTAKGRQSRFKPHRIDYNHYVPMVGEEVVAFVTAITKEGIKLCLNPQWSATVDGFIKKLAMLRMIRAVITGVDKKKKRVTLELRKGAGKENDKVEKGEEKEILSLKVVKVTDLTAAPLVSEGLGDDEDDEEESTTPSFDIYRHPISVRLASRGPIGVHICDVDDDYDVTAKLLGGGTDTKYGTAVKVAGTEEGRPNMRTSAVEMDATLIVKDTSFKPRSSLPVGTVVRGFVVGRSAGDAVVALSALVDVRLPLEGETEKALRLGQLVKVVIETVAKKSGPPSAIRVSLAVDSAALGRPSVKRAAVGGGATLADDSDDEGEKKKNKKSKAKRPKIEQEEEKDPGLDWAPDAFAPQKLASVAIDSKVDSSEEDGSEGEEERPEEQRILPNVSTPMQEVDDDSESDDDDEDEEESSTPNQSRFHPLCRSDLFAKASESTKSSFDKSIAKDANQSRVWVDYMRAVYHTKSGDVDLSAARALAKRAIATINPREMHQRVALWTAWLNLECQSENLIEFHEILERACKMCNPLQMRQRAADILECASLSDECLSVYEAMLAKNAKEFPVAWLTVGEYMMRSANEERAREVMQQALKMLPKTEHVKLLTRFATFELRYGDVERGKTLFESMLSNYPKRTDVWIVYTDMLKKYVNADEARNVLERACALPLGAHRMRSLYARWATLEEECGDEEQREYVRQMAAKYVSNAKELMGSD